MAIIKHHHLLLHLLQACSKDPSLKITRSLHALTITMGPVPNQAIFVHNNLMSQYTSIGMLSMARNLFDEMPHRNVVSYNTMISGYGRLGFVKEAWDLFSEMRNCGFEPTQFTFGGLLSVELLDVWQGAQLQGLSVKNGLFHSGAIVGTALLGLYGRDGCFEEALRVLEDMCWKSLVTWNSILSLLGRNQLVDECKLMFCELMCEGMELSKFSFVGVLSCFSREEDLKFGQLLHGIVIKIGFYYEVLVVNSLLNMYLQCGGFFFADKLFEEVPVRDVVTYNSIIAVGTKVNRPEIALELFYSMAANGLTPTQASFVNAVNSCSCLGSSIYGEYFHSKTVRYALESDVFVGTALIDFYAKFKKLEEAHHCFDEIAEKNVVSWNALILGYSINCYTSSFYLLIKMLHFGYRPNEFTFSAIMKTLLVSELPQIHGLIIRMGYEENDYVSSSLASSYAKHGLISDVLAYVSDSNKQPSVVHSNIVAGYYNRVCLYDETQKLLCPLEGPDLISWNILIEACAKMNEYFKVLELFKCMLVHQIYPDNYTFTSLLSVCAKLCNLALGSSIHGVMIKNGSGYCDTFVCNLLIDMYGKCGSIECALKIFDEVKGRNLITWTVLISVLGLHGHAYEAMKRFAEMELLGLKPDRVALIAVLTACKHGGLVEEGMELFSKMKVKYGVEPEMNHYQCVVDLLSSHGHVVEAEKVIASMPFPPDALLWRIFLEGCKRQRTL
ncbi:pentatricopeptide repeat-containing protein [Cucumis melo var. makuwa]|uniref:Pentatricopeptide repeat-containing protein n=1 Tax=Cucumis melo var. makuwa TaxID=1194695 RepID=A0A5A7UHJ9_CUCMM|nr:pentatricopeptide repeat-containing protein [Cucumis melo var. makuwa]TYK14591.1 pentatricopeptide repeat-containing protein [Cucumis melo var. makuwa]